MFESGTPEASILAAIASDGALTRCRVQTYSYSSPLVASQTVQLLPENPLRVFLMVFVVFPFNPPFQAGWLILDSGPQHFTDLTTQPETVRQLANRGISIGSVDIAGASYAPVFFRVAPINAITLLTYNSAVLSCIVVEGSET